MEGVEKLLNQVERVQLEEGLPEVVFGLEPTGNYHKPLGEYLIRKFAHVVLVSGVAAQRESEEPRWAVGLERCEGCGQRSGFGFPGEVFVL